MARLVLTQPGERVGVEGNVDVFGLNAGGDIVTVRSGTVTFDGSFARGGDTIILQGLASDYRAFRSGSAIVLVSDDGLTRVTIPAGTTGTEIQFSDGEQRTLQIVGGQITLEGQVFALDAPIADLTVSGPPPVVGYDVANTVATVVEGDSGQRLLVFTITLDEAVRAADGPVTINYQTQNGAVGYAGSADSASDYVTTAGTVTFAVGQKVATVSVVVNGDLNPELDEALSLVLSGARLRNGPETLVGVITNDDVAVSLTAATDNIQGSADKNEFFAANTALGAGDKIVDTTAGDNDSLSLFVDATTANRNYGGFVLQGIEQLNVTNDSGKTVTLDLSSSGGIETVASVNSANTVVFNQLTTNASILIDNVTGEDADVFVTYQSSVTSKADTTVNIDITDASVDEIRLGTVNSPTSGIENVNLTVEGDSEINSINTNLTNLKISGNGSVDINDSLATSVRLVDATGVTGDLSLSFANNDVGVDFKGAVGNNDIASGSGDDTIVTYAGDDYILDFGGNGSISTGGGADYITLVNSGNANVNAGGNTDDDTVEFVSFNFDGADTVVLGGSAGDRLILNEGSSAGDYVNVRGATNLQINNATSTDLGSNAGIAGIAVVDLNLAGNDGSNDYFSASGSAPLTVNLGATNGIDTVLLGTGNDTVTTGNFDSADNIQGGGGNADRLVVQGGFSFVAFGNFGGIEQIVYQSSGAFAEHYLILDGDNAPTLGNNLTINAGELTADEYFYLDANPVSTYAVNVTTGTAGDSVYTNNSQADTITTGFGGDYVSVGGGDLANTGGDDDYIDIYAGNNTVNAGSGEDYLSLNSATGNSQLNGNEDDDTFVIGDTTFLTSGDTLNGGSGSDEIILSGEYKDVQFTNVTGIETLIANGVSNITLGLEAQNNGDGINAVVLNDGGDDVLMASAYTTTNLTVTSVGGNDKITTGGGNDTINTGVGTYETLAGAGNDKIQVSGSELDALDKIGGEGGTDAIVLDNSAGAVTGVVDLGNVTSIESYELLASGNRTNLVDADDNRLTFTQTAPDLVTSVTPVNINAAALTDGDDTLTVVIDSSVTDSDFSFNVTANPASIAGITLDKQNVGINNNVRLDGGAGVDTLRIAGSDAGSTIDFNGNGGNDRIIQTGASILTDDGFIGLDSVEVLGADVRVNAVLGSQAARAGINTVNGTAAGDSLVFGVGFNNAVTVNLGGGDDVINGSATAAKITFADTAGNLTAADTISGGSGNFDTLNLTAGGTADLANVSKVEVINVDNKLAGGEATTINLNAATAGVDGSVLTVNVNGSTAGDNLVLNGLPSTENISVNSGLGDDIITTGSGSDTIRAGGGADNISARDGIDTVYGGAGNDSIGGGLGNDTLFGDEDNDILFGEDGNDVLNGGTGLDTLVGGNGADSLRGDAGADTFRYESIEDSRLSPGGNDNRDTILDFTSGSDKIDLTAFGQQLRFNGSYDNFGDGQSAISTGGGDSFLDAVFVRNSSGGGILYVDVNNDAQLDGRDLQIKMDNVSSLVASDLVGITVVANLGFQDVAFGDLNNDLGISPDQQFSLQRFDGGFDVVTFA